MEFSEDCQRWRAWARANLTGTALQLVSAGDAAALTNLLGSVGIEDSVAAARAAAALNVAPDESTPLTLSWSYAGIPIESPEATFERLAEVGWGPVSLRGHRVPGTETTCVAVWAAERVIGNLETVEVKSTAQRVGEGIGFWAPDSLIGGLIGEAVVGGIVKATQGGKKTEAKRVWQGAGKFQYFITPAGIYYSDNGKPARYTFDQFMFLEFAALPKEAVQVLVKDNVLIHFRVSHAPLQSMVLGRMWRQYWLGRLNEQGLARKAVADSNDPVASPREALTLARSYRGIGYIQGAVDYFETATTASDSKVSSNAFNELGNIWIGQRDFDRARDAYMHAIEIGDPGVTALALRNLAITERRAGNTAAAIAACNRAIDMSHPEFSPEAMCTLAAIYGDDLQDWTGARRACEQAMASGHADYAPQAAYMWGMMLAKQGDYAAAVNSLHQAVTSGHKDWSPRASFFLGQWYGVDWADVPTGRRFLEEAAASGHAEWAAKAREVLAQPPFVGAVATTTPPGS